MPFFGILWVASLLNCSFNYGFQGSHISDYLASAFKNNPLAKISNPLWKLTKQSAILGAKMTTDERNLNISNGVQSILVSKNIPIKNISIKNISIKNTQPIPNPLIAASLSSVLTPYADLSLRSSGIFGADVNKPPSEAKFASWWLKSGEENFCISETNSLEYSGGNLPNINGGEVSRIDVPSQESSKLSLPAQIIQFVNGLLRWQDYFASKPKSMAAEVVVVRSDTLMPPQTRRNFWLFSQKPQETVFSDAQQSPGATVVSSQPKFQVWLKRHLIADFEQKLDADLLAQRLRQLVSTPSLDPEKLQPGLVGGEPVIKLDDRLLLVVDDALKASIRTNKELIAVKLTNNIRLALGGSALDLAQAQTTMYKLSETSTRINGLASWYGSYFDGRQTANGETYNQYALTVAHPSLPFDTYLKVTNQKNNKSVIVRVNDRGPYIAPRVLDLSTIAARCIESEETGVVMVDAVIMESKRDRK